MSRLDELNAEIDTLSKRLSTLRAERAELMIAAQNPFPIGSVIGWGSAQLRGRVTEHHLSINRVDYAVVNIRRDGSEGDRRVVRYYDKPELIAEAYEEGQAYAPKPSSEPRTPTELAQRIDAHLDRIAAQEKASGTEIAGMYYPSATPAGRYVMITYVAYQDEQSMTREEAGAYLDWLDAGNVGTHYDWQRAARAAAQADAQADA